MEVVSDCGATRPPNIDYTSLSDEALIGLICAGSEEATVAFFNHRYGHTLQTLARKYGEDLVSDIFHHLYSEGTWSRLLKWNGSSKFSTWLAIVAYNLNADKWKARNREADNLRKYASSVRRLEEEDRVERDQPTVAIMDGEDHQILRSEIVRALNSLPPREQLLISLLDLTDPPVTVESVAEMLGLSLNAVRVAHTRARQHLGRVLKRDGGKNHE